MIARVRTGLVALLLAVVAMRWSLSQPLSTVTARIVGDPGEAIRAAGDGWSVVGTLGGASGQGIRELPYALLLWAGTEAGLSAHAVETGWRVLVLVLAAVGAVRLARGLAARDRDRGGDGAEPWTPWVGAVLFVLSAVLVPTLVRSPTDGLAAATLPWVVAPLLTRGLGWRPALASAVWLGVAGVGGPGWALAALGCGLVAALPRSRADALRSLRWLLLAGAASAWWIALLVWETRYVSDVSALTQAGFREALAAEVGRPDSALLVLVALVAGPLVVALGGILLRSPGLDRRFVGVVLALGAAVLLLDWFGDWEPMVPAPTAGERPESLVGPVLGCLALGGLVAWGALVDDLASPTRRAGRRELAPGRRDLVGLLVAALVALTALTGVAAAAAEPTPIDATESDLLDAVAGWTAEAAPGRVLVLPAHPGSTDLAAVGAALGGRPWVGRDAMPVSGASGTAALDDLLRRLGRGDGGPGTLSALQRLGISYVLVRLGGAPEADQVAPTGLVRSAMRSLGARRVVLRAPAGAGTEPDALVDLGVRSPTPQAEIWTVPWTADGWVYPGAPVDAVGDPGTPSDLADAGVLRDRAVRLRPASDAESVVLSDSARRRDVDQRVPVDPYGPDLADDAPRSVVPPDAAPVTTASRILDGAVSVSASSSAADLDGDSRAPGSDAAAAIDADGFTSWQSRRGTGVDEWWQVEFDGPTDLSETTVQFRQSVFTGLLVSRVEVAADDRVTSYDVPADGHLELGDIGWGTRLRITVTGVRGRVGADDSVGIVDVTGPGLTVSHRLALADAPTASWLLAARLGSRTRCVPAVPRGPGEPADPATACNGGLEVSGPDASTLDRTITVRRAGTVVGRAWLTAAETGDAGALADRIAEPSVVVTGTSVATADLVSRPQAAADADPRTAWRPAVSDEEPGLTLAWTTPADVDAVRVVPPDGEIGSRPTTVRVTVEAIGRRTGERLPDLIVEAAVAADGTIRLPRVHTRKLTIAFVDDTDVPSTDSATGGVVPMPVAVAEVELVGGPAVTYAGSRVERLRCADGPSVRIDGVEHRTRLEVTPDQIVSAAAVRATLCREPVLRPGERRVTISATQLWQPRGLLLASADRELGAALGPVPDLAGPVPLGVDVLSRTSVGDPVALELGSGDAERTLALALPAASGWTATVDGSILEPVTVDGWAQGWIVPAGSGEVTVRYSAGVDVGRVVLGASLGWGLVLAVLVGIAGSSVARAVVSPRRVRSSR